MEIAEIILAVFTVAGVAYGAVQLYRANHTPKLKRELSVGLWLRAEKLPEGTRCVVLVFDNRGCLARKFPQAECSHRKDRHRIRCVSTPGEHHFCVLMGTDPLNLLYCIALVACLTLLTACSPEEELRLPARHTLLVYLAGDNNLSRETTQKVKAIADGFHESDCHLLVYQDYNHAAAGEEANPLLLKLEATGAHSAARIDTLERYAPENSASAEVFGRVLRQVAQAYPAQSHGLLLFSHGTGWLPQGTFARPRSITTDGKSEMEVRHFAAVLPDGHFDYIVFEACLMAGVEVAYELRHKTRYVLASSAEIISPGFTPVYPELIPYLLEPAPNLIGFARRFHTSVDGLSGLYRSSTLSVIATEGLEELARQVVPVLRQARQPAPEAVQEFNRNAALLYFDLGHYMELTARPEQLQQFRKALDKVVIYQAATPQFVGAPVKHHSGLTVYLRQEKYPYLNAEYERYQFGYALHHSARQTVS